MPNKHFQTPLGGCSLRNAETNRAPRVLKFDQLNHVAIRVTAVSGNEAS
jgi:hypothetical protein